MLKRILNIALLSLIIISCNDPTSPIGEVNTDFVQSEMKWAVDNVSLEKQYLYSEKTFDKNGNILSHLIYYNTGDLKCESLFSYSGNNSTEKYRHYNLEGDVTDEMDILYVLDKKGNILEKTTNDADGDMINHLQYSYDNYGNLVELVETDENANVKTTNYEYVYGSGGNVLEMVSFSSDDSNFERDSISYSENSNKIERFSFDASGNLNIVTSYLYNPNGQIFLEIESDANGLVRRTFMFEYKYF